MKTSILALLFVFAFTVSVSGATEKGQTNPHNYDHPLLALYNKLHLGNQQFNQSRFKNPSQFNLNSVEHQGWDGEGFTSYYKVDHVYQSGKRTEVHHSYRSDIEESWDITSRELFHYENDRLISIVNQIHSGQTYVNDYKVKFTYQLIDGQYFLYETIDQYWDGGQSDWINDERITLIASNGKLSIGESSSWTGDDWDAYELFFLEEQGDDLYVTYQEPYGSMWMNTSRLVFMNYTITDLYSVFLNEINMVESGSFLEFANVLPDYTSQYWTGTDWTDDERQVTVVDYNWQTGEMISKQITGQQFDDEWLTFTEVRISYEDGFPSEMVLSVVDDYETGELFPVYAEDYTYDTLGLLHYIIQKQSSNESESISNDLEVTGRLILHWSGIITSIEDNVKPITFRLGNAYPNPFNPSTVIPFEVGSTSHISIKVYDMLGRFVSSLADEIYTAGNHSVRFDGSGLASGVYLIRMDAPQKQQSRRVTLLK